MATEVYEGSFWLYDTTHPNNPKRKDFFLNASTMAGASIAVGALRDALMDLCDAGVGKYSSTWTLAQVDAPTAPCNNDEGLILTFKSDVLTDPAVSVRLPAPRRDIIVGGQVSILNTWVAAMGDAIVDNTILKAGAQGVYQLASAYIEYP